MTKKQLLGTKGLLETTIKAYHDEVFALKEKVRVLASENATLRGLNQASDEKEVSERRFYLAQINALTHANRRLTKIAKVTVKVAAWSDV